MQTVTRRIFLFGICAVAFHILALNSHVAALMFFSAAVLAAFALFALIVLTGRLVDRHYNKKRLQAMRNQMKGVASILDKYEPKHMPPGSMHEMPPEGDYGQKLESIRKSVEVLEARVGSLEEATALHDEIEDLHAELMHLWTRALGGMPFPKLR